MNSTHINAQDLGKRFRNEWIFQKLSFQWDNNQSYAILGGNGSGKSTLLQIIAASLSPSAGSIHWQHQQQTCDNNHVFQLIAWSAPYIELIEELSLREVIEFHAQFKPFRQQYSTNDLLLIAQLHKAADKQIRHFSSGMKQRAKLLLAILADTPILLLDEPTTNLDSNGIDWYRQLMSQHSSQRLVIIASNQRHEYDFCQTTLQIEHYKKP